LDIFESYQSERDRRAAEQEQRDLEATSSLNTSVNDEYQSKKATLPEEEPEDDSTDYWKSAFAAFASLVQMTGDLNLSIDADMWNKLAKEVGMFGIFNIDMETFL
jgi:hypothetical protein